MDEEDFDYENGYSIMVPVLTDELTTMTFVVPREFAHRVEMHALQVIESFEQHPSTNGMDPNNKMMQAMSFIIQNAFQTYLVLDDGPPEII